MSWMTAWRNGSASDSRSEGYVFESRRGHFFLSTALSSIKVGWGWGFVFFLLSTIFMLPLIVKTRV